MNGRFAGKVVIVTGAGTGLGLAAALRLAQEGAELSLVDVNAEALGQRRRGAARRVAGRPRRADHRGRRASRRRSRPTSSGRSRQLGRIDGLYNNAGIEGKQDPVETYDAEMLDKVLAVNLKGVLYGMKHTLSHFKAQGSGAIVNAASVGGIRAVPNLVAYVASKHAVAGMTKQAAIEYGEFGVRVNAVAPGAILTDMIKGSLIQIGGRGRLGGGRRRVRHRQPDEALRPAGGGGRTRRLPALRRRLLRQRHRRRHRRRPVPGLLRVRRAAPVRFLNGRCGRLPAPCPRRGGGGRLHGVPPIPNLTRPSSLRARVRTRSTEALVFSGAAVLALAHAFDDALPAARPAASRSPGTRSRWRSRVVATVAADLQVRLAAARPPRRDRVHVRRARGRQRRPPRPPHPARGHDGQRRHRCAGARRRRRARRPRRLDPVPPSRRGRLEPRAALGDPRRPCSRSCLLAVIFFFMPGRHGDRRHPLAAPSRSAARRAPPTRPSTFTTSDGARPRGAGTARRSNGASVLMLSGGSGDIRSTIRHAKMLVRHGYGVLLFGGRGTGNSEGTVNSYGWGREKDAAAALDYLATRDDVEPGPRRRARALDRRRHRDRHRRPPRRRQAPWSPTAPRRSATRTSRRSRDDPVTRVGDVGACSRRSRSSRAAPGPTPRSPTRSPAAARRTCSSPRASSRRSGASSTTAPAATASELWYLPKASHTAALRQYPRAYEQRVVSFFDAHLSRSGAVGRLGHERDGLAVDDLRQVAPAASTKSGSW